ncbi:unannotated protein [freshwater metagenome]|uniref:Unannotated protein n=1 Tax=freshwater metagenome TaxID=449393 RepID=A0A6J6YZB4_9ZZZZ|nr:hypothetical protein [Actinomycetota bacterium]
MNSNQRIATGPTTSEGKSISSKNATKDAIFSKGLLPWEDARELEDLMMGLQKQWGNHASARILMLPIEQAYIEMRRLMMAQKKRIEGVMLSTDIARQFVQEAGFAELSFLYLPHWFFLESGQDEKDYAIFIDRVQEEALKLKANFHDQIVPTIAQKFSNLYQYVMENQPSHASILTVLGQHYRQPTPALNLGALSNKIGEDFKYHLQWATNPKRYEGIIEGIRAQQMIGAMDLEKFHRYLTRTQNAMTKGIQALAQLKETLRLEGERVEQKKLHSNAIEIVEIHAQASNASPFKVSGTV